jgi:hypothetical protein
MVPAWAGGGEATDDGAPAGPPAPLCPPAPLDADVEPVAGLLDPLVAGPSVPPVAEVPDEASGCTWALSDGWPDCA